MDAPERERPPVKVYPCYEREVAGVLIHIDAKRPLRFFTPESGSSMTQSNGAHGLAGNACTVAIDDHTRMVYAEVLTGQGKDASCAFLHRSIQWFEA